MDRIRTHADSLGIKLNTTVFSSRSLWEDYAVDSLRTVERLASEVGLARQLHLWPDKSLGSAHYLKRVTDPDAHRAWLERWWSRISEWP